MEESKHILDEMIAKVRGQRVRSINGYIAISVGELTPSEGDQVLTVKDYDNKIYKNIICRDNHIIGAAFLNVAADAGAIQYLINKEVDIGDYKELLLEKPRETSLWLMLETERREGLSLET